MSTVEQREDNDDNETEEPLEYEGWLTGAQAAAATGLTLPSISRLAQSGELVRKKVDGRWLYDPQTVAARLKPGTDVPAATAAATAGLIKAMSDMIPALMGQVIQMSQAHQTATSRLIEQLTERCALLEKTQTEMLVTRESYLDGKADREIANKQAEWAMGQKERVINGVVANAPMLLELLSMFMASQKGGETSEPESVTVEASNVDEDRTSDS